MLGSSFTQSRSPFQPFRIELGNAVRILMGFVLLRALEGSAQDPATLSIEQLKSGIENQHPSYLYILAEKLFMVGKKDEAVF
jgi:hypothetical protein